MSAAPLHPLQDPFYATVMAAPVGIAPVGLDGHFLLLNDAACEITGYPREELLRRTFAEITHPEDLEADWVEARRLREGAITRSSREKRYVHKNGAPVWVLVTASLVRDAEGRPRHFISIIQDINDRKRIEAALRESEERFRRVAEAAPVKIWMSGPDMGCVWFNQRWLRFVGRSMAQEVGFGWAENVHPDDLERTLATYRAAFTARQTFAMEYRLRRNDGVYRWMLDQGLPRHGPSGDFAGYIGSCTDIDDRRRYEETLKSADRRKDEFLATLAHELRTPLSPIRTGLHVLQRVPGDSPEAQRTRAMIDRQIDQLVHLVDDLLDVARVSQGKIALRLTRLLSRDLVSAAVEVCRPEIDRRRHTLTISISDEPLFIEGDQTRLTQVLVNLLTNAAKYTNPGGSIKVVLRRSDDQALFEVSDSGVGIAPEVLPTIWDLFTQVRDTLEKAQGGLGIGLSLVRKLVELHGGTVAAHSPGVGQGATFCVHLPLVAAPEAIAAPATRTRASLTAPGRRVLVVDDSRDAAETLALLVELSGHEARVAYDGPSALEIARGFQPQVVLLDIGLPGMSGYDVARAVRADPRLRSALLVAVTGWGADEDRRRSREAGFDLHLTKPTDAAELAAAIDSA